jgi:hypothetical protein
MRTLRELAEEYGADKSEHLVETYEWFLTPLRKKSIALLEIGVKSGGSIRLWRDYFPRGRIYGLDNRPGTGFEGERLRIFIGDQADPAVLDRIVAESGPLDIVIDDGSHQPGDQRASLLHIWPQLAPGGLYVIEDIHTSYKLVGRFTEGYRKPGTTMEFLKALLDDTHVYMHGVRPTLEQLDSVHISYAIALLRKGSLRSHEEATRRYKATFLHQRRDAGRKRKANRGR